MKNILISRSPDLESALRINIDDNMILLNNKYTRDLSYFDNTITLLAQEWAIQISGYNLICKCLVKILLSNKQCNV